MDNCKRIKDLILTDYIDNQLDSSSKDQVENHLLSCKTCQNFAMEVKERLMEPLASTFRQELSSEIWETLKQKIFQEQTKKQGLGDWILGWIGSISFPRLVPVLVSLVMVVFISSTIFLNWQTKQAQDQEQGAYVEFMLSSATVSNHGDNHDLGTPIEQYFL